MSSDRLRRIKYQDAQRLKQQAVKDFGKSGMTAWGGYKPPEGQLKSFTSKLVK